MKKNKQTDESIAKKDAWTRKLLLVGSDTVPDKISNVIDPSAAVTWCADCFFVPHYMSRHRQ